METHKNIVLGFIISFLHLLSESRRRSQFRNWILKIIKTVSASSFSYFPEVLFGVIFNQEDIFKGRQKLKYDAIF